MEFIDINIDLIDCYQSETDLYQTETDQDLSDTMIGRPPPDPDIDPEKQEEINRSLEILTYIFGGLFLAGVTYIILKEQSNGNTDN